MDRETEQAVWRRVTRPGITDAEEALLPQRLEQMILEQRMNAGELRQIAARLNGGERNSFLRMASETEGRAGELTTLHYLLTGRRLRLRVPGQPPVGDLPQAMRSAYLKQKQSARGFQNLARDFEAYAGQMERMSSQAQSHSDRILRILQGKLRWPEQRPQRR